MSEEKKVEQDKRGSSNEHQAAVQIAIDLARSMGNMPLAAGLGDVLDLIARVASTSTNVDRFDPYRLKVAEECCERLMSACTDAGCPDGVRMDDWIRENVRSTSANVAQGAEAVALTEDQRQILEWCKNYHFRRCVEGDFHLRIVAVVNQILTAPPAQPALTDEARDSLKWAADRAHIAALGKPIDGVEGLRWRTLRDLLAAAQSGDKS